MKRSALSVARCCVVVSCWSTSAWLTTARTSTETTVETIPDAVRVTMVKSGGEHTVASVSGGGGGRSRGVSGRSCSCRSSMRCRYGTDVGAEAASGRSAGAAAVQRDDRAADLGGAGRRRRPRRGGARRGAAVHRGRARAGGAHRGEPGGAWAWWGSTRGSGSTASTARSRAPPITAFGLTIEVRMSSGTVTWDFGDGTVETGDLGRAYPEESTVRHVHQHDGTFTITGIDRPRARVPRRRRCLAHAARTCRRSPPPRTRSRSARRSSPRPDVPAGVGKALCQDVANGAGDAG